MWSRTGRNWTDDFAAIAVQSLLADTVLDGEAVAPCPNGSPDFHARRPDRAGGEPASILIERLGPTRLKVLCSPPISRAGMRGIIDPQTLRGPAAGRASSRKSEAGSSHCEPPRIDIARGQVGRSEVPACLV